MIKSIFNGIKAYFGTFSLISKLGLWKYFGIPIAISVFTGFLVMFLVYTFSDDVGALIAKAWIWEWGSETFGDISVYLGGAIILVIGLILYKHIVMAFSAPFMSPVSEKIEAHMIGTSLNHSHTKTSFGEQLARGIRINVRNLIRELLFMIPLLLLTLIPVVGIIFTVFIFLIQAYYIGFGNMDYTMERHFNYKQSIQFVRKHRGTAIGNGIVFVFMLFIPILGFIITLPIAVVAATTETVKILNTKSFTSPNTTPLHKKTS